VATYESANGHTTVTSQVSGFPSLLLLLLLLLLFLIEAIADLLILVYHANSLSSILLSILLICQAAVGFSASVADANFVLFALFDIKLRK